MPLARSTKVEDFSGSTILGVRRQVGEAIRTWFYPLTAAVGAFALLADGRVGVHHPGVTAARVELEGQDLWRGADLDVDHVRALLDLVLERLHDGPARGVRPSLDRVAVDSMPALEVHAHHAVRSGAGSRSSHAEVGQ